MLTHAQVIQRLCKLLSEVADKQVGWHHPTPCICGENLLTTPNDRTDGAALTYIEQTVRQALTSPTPAVLVGEGCK